MRQDWVRAAPTHRLDIAQVAELVRPMAPADRVLAATPVTGGLVNTNLAVTLSGSPGRILLRLYPPPGNQARKEAAIERLVRYYVPTARFVHFGESNPFTGSPYALLTWIEGERLDQVVGRELGPALPALGKTVGRVLARIHAFRFDKFGFLTTDLAVPKAIEFDHAGLLNFLDRCLRDGPARARLGTELADRLLVFAEREGARLDAWPSPPRLTHADFNPTNILVRRETGDWQVAAVLDWEFALSATPGLDFGNLLRPPLGEEAGFVVGLEQGYRAAGGWLPADWMRIARITDLFAWAEMLARPDEDPARNADARRNIAATIAAFAA